MKPFSGCQPMLTTGGRVHRPRPVDAQVERIGVGADRALGSVGASEIRLTEKHARDEQRRIDCRELDLLEAEARLHVEEVVEESLVTGDVRRLRTLRRVVHEAQRGERARRGVGARDISALDADRVRRQSEPTAAMLEKLFDGQRSGVSPLFALVRSQNQLNVRRSSVSRNAVWRGVSADGGIGALTPVIDVALVHADARNRYPEEARRNHRLMSVT